MAERIRTANRLADNEGKRAVVTGLAVDVAGRRAVHLDRDDAIVPLADGTTWGDDRDAIVTATGTLRRHAEANDPATGLSSLELVAEAVEAAKPADDGVVRTAVQLAAAEGTRCAVDGLAYRSSNGNIVVLAGGLVYVPELPAWTRDVVATDVRVRGTVRHGDLPPEAPPAGGSWYLDDPVAEEADAGS